MSVKSEVDAMTIASKPFPKLMINKKGTIVLFDTARKGTIISNIPMIGMYDENWTMDDFVDFNGSVTLSND